MGTLWRKKLSKKNLTMPKKPEGDPLDSPGIACYAEKKEKLLNFSSLCQMVQFDTSNFVSTIEVSTNNYIYPTTVGW